MAIFKCKMCGGTLDITENESVSVCEYCGTQQTLPKPDDEKKLALFNRANNLRLKSEFDKAAGIYESITAEFPEEAEGYWGLVLCKYGIEYVDDKDGKKIPTCHRTLPTPIMNDSDFQQACENADIDAKILYREEAKAIDRIQKKILEIVATEDPYDIFICYKETDEKSGARTEDSAIAQDIYTELIKQGYKVFFSRVTLRGVAGAEYEPYIYAALSSAKIMLAIGTKYEYYDAVWVKNEWSRFISMMPSNPSKVLIPCYKNMDAYDIPEEFSNMQALDMGDMMFFNSLEASVKRVLMPEEKAAQKNEPTITNGATATVESLLKRAFIFLEDGEYDRADDLCEQILNVNPESADAYLVKLLVELKVSKPAHLKNVQKPFDNRNNYQKIMRYGSDSLKAEIKGYIDFINTRNEEARIESIYSSAVESLNNATKESHYNNVVKEFESIAGYKDTDELIKTCYEKAEKAHKEETYEKAMSLMEQDTIPSCESAKELFDTIPGYKDSREQSFCCQARIDELEKWEAEELRKAEEKRKDDTYNSAVKKSNSDDIPTIRSAIRLFERIPDWKDSKEKIDFCNARIKELEIKLEEEKREVERISALNEKKRKNKLLFKKLSKVVAVVIVISVIAYTIAFFAYIKPNGKYTEATKLLEAGKYEEAITIFNEILDFNDSTDKLFECKYLLAEQYIAEENYNAAFTLFTEFENYKDSADKIKGYKYELAEKFLANNELKKAINFYFDIGNYKDAIEKRDSIWDKIAVRQTIDCRQEESFAVKEDGTVISTKFKGITATELDEIANWSDIVSISVSDNHIVGLKSDGNVVATGENYDGRCDVSGWSDIVSLETSTYATYGLKADGTVISTAEIEDLDRWTNIIAISKSDDNLIGLKADGTVVSISTGYNDAYDSSSWTDIVAISAGSDCIFGIKSDGTVVAMGDNENKTDVSSWTDIVAIATGPNHTIGLKADGTVVATEPLDYLDNGQCDVDSWTNIVAIATEFYHTIGLKADGSVVAVGSDSFDRCDVGSWKNVKVPDKADE